MSDKIIAKNINKIQMILIFINFYVFLYITMRKSRVLRIVMRIAHFCFVFFVMFDFRSSGTRQLKLLRSLQTKI